MQVTSSIWASKEKGESRKGKARKKIKTRGGRACKIQPERSNRTHFQRVLACGRGVLYGRQCLAVRSGSASPKSLGFKV
jgi:hypothetical protein